jgi:potassium-transporting ATPase KdpC subunit
MNEFFKTTLRPALVSFGVLTVICGVVYPLVLTSIGQVAFAKQVDGSLIKVGDKVIGSELIGQSFSSPKYLWGRPSATATMPNNASASGGSNQGPTNPALIDAVKGRIDALKAADPANTLPIPVDLVTASASGLDPEISLAGAYYQIARVARERKLSEQAVRDVIAKHSSPQYLGFFGEARVNVLAVNVELDGLVVKN